MTKKKTINCLLSRINNKLTSYKFTINTHNPQSQRLTRQPATQKTNFAFCTIIRNLQNYLRTYKPEIMYTKSDLKQFKRRGIKPEQIENQLENFKQGFDFVQIRDAATINNGIYGLNDEQADEFIRIFEERMNSLKIVKMVPASGSASRMFKTLNTFFNTYTGSDEDYLKFRQDKEPGSIFSFFEKVKEFPFYPHLKEAVYKDRLD